MITISIDVTLLDKERFTKKPRQNGTPATWCNLVLIETPNGKFGDYMVKQDTTKEEREQKVEMPILGNGKIRGQGAKPQGEHHGNPKPAAPKRQSSGDDW